MRKILPWSLAFVLTLSLPAFAGQAAAANTASQADKAVDPRADIWAFSVVLFEMLTGERAFIGDATDTLASVLDGAKLVRASIRHAELAAPR